jgi:hypothetical protein
MTRTDNTWEDVPVYLALGQSDALELINIGTEEKPSPAFLVGRQMLDRIQGNYSEKRRALVYLINQFRDGNLELLDPPEGNGGAVLA